MEDTIITGNEADRQFYYIDKCREWLNRKEEALGRKLTFGIFTFGCQMNFHDSEKIVAILEQIGFINTDREDADFVLYNTCTVRENANERVYGRLGQLKRIKKNNPEMIIGLCGCMAQEEKTIDGLRPFKMPLDEDTLAAIVNVKINCCIQDWYQRNR